MGRRRDTSRRILLAARQQFLTHGVTGTSIRSIAAAAGVDIAAVYYHHGGKDALATKALTTVDDPTDATTIPALFRAVLDGIPDAVELLNKHLDSLPPQQSARAATSNLARQPGPRHSDERALLLGHALAGYFLSHPSAPSTDAS